MRHINSHGYISAIIVNADKLTNKISVKITCFKSIFKNIECSNKMESRQTTDKNKKSWNYQYDKYDRAVSYFIAAIIVML
jgi:hypothetical protein